MNKLIQSVKQFMNDEEGVTAIEYGLIAALIACAIIIGAGAVGTNLDALFTSISALLVMP
ncbi:Flp family type IVb pilin [Nitrosomonas communis]|uniref:Flp family type IVb pilin n=1 Tax=Nitrosomonas communis TaxID=44574 RepID=UPI003D2D0828